ncbi:MAG: hypothetical protein ACJA0Q_000204 [Saprospiraceae bacterium]|jgi:hypothetical protein
MYKCVVIFLFPTLLLGQNFSNQSFNDSVKSIFLSTNGITSISSSPTNTNGYQLPAIKLNQANALTLHFDLLSNEYVDYSYTLVHCNPDWTPSDLFSNEYLEGYSEDNILDFTYSQNTSQNYIHYSQSFPDDNMVITKTGNYVILVYPVGKRNQVVLCQKFYVVKQNVSITPLPSSSLSDHKSVHQINFKINQSNINSTDPRNEFKVAVLKNQNYYNLKFYLPTYISGNLLSYNSSKMNIEAGNEFRQFDTRNINLNTNGYGVYKFFFQDNQYHSILNPSKIRTYGTYSSLIDHNGNQYIQSQSHRSSHSETDYTWVYFYLNYPTSDSTLNIYLWGALTDWEKKSAAKMTFNKKSSQYIGKLFLKQGVYDFAYLADEKGKLTWATIEGNYYETDNYYSVLVYHKSFTSNYYELVGLKSFNYN